MSKQSEQARQLVNYYVDQLSGWSHITTRPLFGAVALCRNDHVFAMVWQGALYFKVDDQSRVVYEAAHSQPLEHVRREHRVPKLLGSSGRRDRRLRKAPTMGRARLSGRAEKREKLV